MPLPETVRSILMSAIFSTALMSTASQAQDEIIRGDIPPMPEPSYHPDPQGIEVQTFAAGLEVVWSIEFSPDGRVFVTERPGRVQVFSLQGERQASAWLDIEDRVFF